MNLRKRTCLDTAWNSRIFKIFSGLAGISIEKLPSGEPKTLWWPLFAGPYLSNPSSVSHNSRTLRKRVAQAFRRYQERRKPTSGARSTVRANTEKKIRKTRWKSDSFFLPDNRLRARISSGSLRFDPRAWMHKKDCNSSYKTQLSVRWWLPPFGQNLHQKNTKKQLGWPDFWEP